MRKVLACFLVLTMPVTTFAATVDVHSVIVQNNETTDLFTLNSETTRTAYRTEVVESTCYRQEIERYERVCDYNRHFNVVGLLASLEPRDKPARDPRPPREPGTPSRPSEPAPREPRPPREPSPPSRPDPRPEPRPPRPSEPRPDPRPPRPSDPRPDPRPPRPSDPRPDPRPPRPSDPRPDPRPPRPNPTCYDRPVYRTVAYTCSKTVSVPYEVRENHSATTNVKVSAAPASRPQTGSCGIDFKLVGENHSAHNSCVEYIATANISKSSNGRDSQYNYDITLHDGIKILAPLKGGLKGLKLESGTFIVAKVGNLNEAADFSLKLYVERNKVFGKDVTLINRVLKSTEYSYQPIDDQTGYVRINSDKVFGGIQNNKKHNIKLTLTVVAPVGTIIPGGALTEGTSLTQVAETTVD